MGDGWLDTPQTVMTTRARLSNLWQEPWNAAQSLLYLKNSTFQTAVCERVFLIKGQLSLIWKETVSLLWMDVLDVFR